MKQYNTELQEQIKQFLKEENLSQAKAAPIFGISSSMLSQYLGSKYDKGDIEALESRLKEFFQIRKERNENASKAEPFKVKAMSGYIPTKITEEAYQTIRYCQLQKGIAVIDGDSGVGKTRAAAKFLQDNPSTTVYVKAAPSTSSVRSILRLIARALKISDSQRTEELSMAIYNRLRQTDTVLIIDEAQALKFLALEEIRNWVDEDIFTGKREVGIVLIGNVEVYDRMLGKQEAVFSQQFNRSRLHKRCRTDDIRKEDVEKFFPVLKEKGMQKELNYLLSISHSKWGIRGMLNVFEAAVDNEDISFSGLEKIANTLGILLIQGGSV